MTVDLWKFDIAPIPDTRPPSMLLKEQAEVFNDQMMKWGLICELGKNGQKSNLTKLSFSLDIVVPNLNDYRLRVLRCSFKVTANYPVTVESEYGAPYLSFGSTECATEEAFEECIASVFTDEGLRTAIGSLITNASL